MSASLRCGPFDLLEILGQGSSAVVWRGLHRDQGVAVALKVLRLHRARISSAFRNEVRAAARLDHPNVVMLFEQGHVSPEDARASEGQLEEGAPFLAMELCRGGSLADQERRPSWNRLRGHLQEILEALAHAHSRGVIHRDLKPGNALLQQGDEGSMQIKLSDFGIAHALIGDEGEVDLRQERLSGTLQYMAPEQLSGQWRQEGPWTDLYALGIMTYEAMGGRAPWTAKSRRELVAALLKSPPPLRARTPVPEGLQNWLDRLLARRPIERFQSAAVALRALQELKDPVVWQAGQPQDEVDARPPARPGGEASLETGGFVALPSSTPQRPLSLQGVGLDLYGLRPARLAGREREKRLAWSKLREAVQSRRPQLMLLRGPMGVGTSKLAEWLGENAHATVGAGVMQATHSPIPGPGDGLPSMLSRHLGCAGLSAEMCELRCARILEDFPLPDDGPLDQSSLETLLGAATEGEPSLALPAQHHTLLRGLQRVTRTQPIVLTIDNAQWAHNALRFCQSLLDDSHSQLPILILALVDDEAVSEESAEFRDLAALEADARVEVLHLGDIAPKEHRKLVADLLGLCDELVDRVCHATHGDALFASALLRHWVRTGALHATPAGFALREEFADAMPETLAQLWDWQLRSLAGKLEDTGEESLLASLEIAAALGESVHDNEWRAACARAGVPVVDGLVQALTELQIAIATRLGWRFKHSIMRQHLESQARRAGRKDAQHRACAAALSALSRGRNLIAGRIGQHLLEAGDAASAIAPLMRGAVAARERSDWSESHRLFALVESALDSQADDAEAARVEAWVERIPCYVSQGRIEQAEGLAGDALRAAESGKWSTLEARARMAKASIAFAQSDLQTALEELQRALALLNDQDALLRLHTLTRLGSLCMWRRELHEASHHFREAQAIVGDDPAYRAERGQTLRGMAHLAHCHEDYATATRLMEEARNCFSAQGNRFATASCINDLGELQRHQGCFDEAEALYREAEALFESVGAADATTARCNLGYLLIERHRYAQAEAILKELEQSALTRERQIDRLWILSGLLACVAARGDWQSWDHLAADIAPLTSQGLVDEDLAKVARHAADLARRVGQFKRARWAYGLALEQLERMENRKHAEEIRQLLADLG